MVMDAAHRAALRRVNQAIERLLSDLNRKPPAERIPPEQLERLPGCLRLIREQMASLEQWDLRGCEADSEVMAYRRNLQKLQLAPSRLQAALVSELQRITARLAETKAARSWSDLLKNISA